MERLSWVRDHLQKQSSEIRTFCNELRPPTLASFGLEKAIRSHVEEYQKRHSDLVINLNLQSEQQTLPEETRMALFRIYQESLNNIVKHSKAGQAWITLSLDEKEACLEIEDNGVGFELPCDWVAQARSGHLGLLGMRERVQSIGGEIEFDSRPGQGTRVRVVVPSGSHP
jgi:signal transduction histidine kinase